MGERIWLCQQKLSTFNQFIQLILLWVYCHNALSLHGHLQQTKGLHFTYFFFFFHKQTPIPIGANRPELQRIPVHYKVLITSLPQLPLPENSPGPFCSQTELELPHPSPSSLLRIPVLPVVPLQSSSSFKLSEGLSLCRPLFSCPLDRGLCPSSRTGPRGFMKSWTGATLSTRRQVFSPTSVVLCPGYTLKHSRDSLKASCPASPQGFLLNWFQRGPGH